MALQTICSLAHWPARNAMRSFYFFSLSSGWVIGWCNWQGTKTCEASTGNRFADHAQIPDDYMHLNGENDGDRDWLQALHSCIHNGEQTMHFAQYFGLEISEIWQYFTLLPQISSIGLWCNWTTRKFKESIHLIWMGSCLHCSSDWLVRTFAYLQWSAIQKDLSNQWCSCTLVNGNVLPLFQEQRDVTGKQDICIKVKLLAYGCSPLAFQDFFQMVLLTIHVAFIDFSRIITSRKQLRQNSLWHMTKATDCFITATNLCTHGINGMAGSLDWVHGKGKNCSET